MRLAAQRLDTFHNGGNMFGGGCGFHHNYHFVPFLFYILREAS
jgi:hypothetical protein